MNGDIEMDKRQKQKIKESSEQPITNQPNYMDNFFRDVDNIKADIEFVDVSAKQISRIHEQALSATTNDDRGSARGSRGTVPIGGIDRW